MNVITMLKLNVKRLSNDQLEKAKEIIDNETERRESEKSKIHKNVGK